ncbi:MAG TPA: hypothetical protein VL793_09280 [Patescibacteria group bacterium]|jgi:hypothetical protein|nr:hypothetical protein [Patescibacteria group bacterium]
MSLINDALRRAKQAQQDTSDSPPPVHLRPVEPSQQPARHSLAILVPIALVIVALLGLLLFWVLLKKEGPTASTQTQTPIAVSARTPATDPASVAKPSADTTIANPVTLSGAAITPHTENAAGPAGSDTIAPSLSSTNQGSGTAANPDTNQLATPLAAPPAPAPLRLQSIVYNPRKPSAMINGRIVFVGDRIRDFHVAAIHKDDVVLTGAAGTNTLSLEP